MFNKYKLIIMEQNLNLAVRRADGSICHAVLNASGSLKFDDWCSRPANQEENLLIIEGDNQKLFYYKNADGNYVRFAEGTDYHYPLGENNRNYLSVCKEGKHTLYFINKHGEYSPFAAGKRIDVFEQGKWIIVFTEDQILFYERQHNGVYQCTIKNDGKSYEFSENRTALKINRDHSCVLYLSYSGSFIRIKEYYKVLFQPDGSVFALDYTEETLKQYFNTRRITFVRRDGRWEEIFSEGIHDEDIAALGKKQ